MVYEEFIRMSKQTWKVRSQVGVESLIKVIRNLKVHNPIIETFIQLQFSY